MQACTALRASMDDDRRQPDLVMLASNRVGCPADLPPPPPSIRASTSTFTSGRGFLRRLNREVKETRKSVRASTGKVGRRETTVRVLTKHGIPPTSEFVVESFCQALSTAGPRLVTTRLETACDCRAFIPPCCSCQVMSAAGWQCHRHWRLRRWVRKFCVLGSSSRIHESEAS